MSCAMPDGDSVRSVAVFRALRLGDMLCAVPALRALRTGLPQARLTLVGLPWAESFTRRFRHYLNDFVAFPGHPALPEQTFRKDEAPGFYRAMRNRGFDLAIQLHGDGRVSNGIVAAFGARVATGFEPERRRDGFLPYPRHGQESTRLVRLAQFLGMPVGDACMEFPLEPEDYAELAANGLAEGLADGNYVCVHPGASNPRKRWPPAGFAAVADRLAEEFGCAVVLTGSAEERDLTAAVASHMRHAAIDAAAPISVGAMAALMNGARLLVCNDTGVSHIAAGLRLPSVVIFLDSDMERWAPVDRRLHASLWRPGDDVDRVLAHARRLLRARRSSSAD